MLHLIVELVRDAPQQRTREKSTRISTLHARTLRGLDGELTDRPAKRSPTPIGRAATPSLGSKNARCTRLVSTLHFKPEAKSLSRCRATASFT